MKSALGVLSYVPGKVHGTVYPPKLVVEKHPEMLDRTQQ